MPLDSETRFWNKVAISGPNECWLWTASTNGTRQRRPVFGDKGQRFSASRWIWQKANNATLSVGQVVMHLCDQPLCVNPAHLKAGTQAENVEDMWKKGRAPLAAIRRGASKGRDTLRNHPERRARGDRHGVHKRDLNGSNNPQASLNENDVRQIRDMHPAMSQKDLAAKFGVHKAVIWRIVHGKAWTHV